ncbi:MAG: Septum formation initiator [Verrucomicrobia bacterium]|nr:MAG: Septum formation initiator [Verrucomicrobiota bacterium]
MSDRFFENQAPAVPPVWVSLNRALASAIVLLVVGTLAVRYLPETSKRNEIQSDIQVLEAKVAEKRALLKRHEREERLLRTNSEYLSMVARERLDLMQEGETLFRFDALPKR